MGKVPLNLIYKDHIKILVSGPPVESKLGRNFREFCANGFQWNKHGTPISNLV